MAGSVVTSFIALASPAYITASQGAQLTAKRGWGPSVHRGFAWALLRLASPRGSAGTASLGALFSSAATTSSGLVPHVPAASFTGIASCQVHITTRSRRRTRAARECAPERGRWAS